MGINEKIRNAKTSEWISEGLSNEKIKEIKKLAVISAQIQLRRIEMGMNQKQFAKMMGVTQGMISKWESGKYNFTIKTLDEIYDRLGLEFSPTVQNNTYNVCKMHSIKVTLNDHVNLLCGLDMSIVTKGSEVIA